MKRKFVDELKWIDQNEMNDIVSLAQSSPGAVAINACILIGHRIAGIRGALLAVLGAVLPPFVIISVISYFYTAFRDNRFFVAILKGMQAGVAAVIADVVISLIGNLIKKKELIAMLIMIGAFIAVFVFKVSPLYVIITCGLIGLLNFRASDPVGKAGELK
jgi:chromate transporter